MIGVLVPTLLATAGVYASPIHKRGLDQVASQCKHGFAYTFDGGPSAPNSEVVDKFDNVGGKTSFFVNGDNGGCIFSDDNVKALRYAFEKGHLIGSLTWSGADLGSLPEDKIDEEVERLDNALVKILGVKPKLFRPPNSSINDTTASYIQSKHGKTIVMSDAQPDNTQGGATEQKVTDFFKNIAAEGPNANHLALSQGANLDDSFNAAKNGAVDALHNAGVPLLTVAQCLDIADPYEHVGSYGEKDATWTCDATTTSSKMLTRAACKEIYNSNPGDTCSSIEAKYHLGQGAIQGANPSLNCADIKAGTGVCIPADRRVVRQAPNCDGDHYTSQQWDTCSSIDQKFNLPAGTVQGANSFLNCADIWAGTDICIPRNRRVVRQEPNCDGDHYTSQQWDTCASIDQKFNLPAGTVQGANPSVNCADIWAGTNICIPRNRRAARDTESGCKEQKYTSQENDTCATIESKFGLQAGNVHELNPTVPSDTSITPGTVLDICVPVTDPTKDNTDASKNKSDASKNNTDGSENGLSAWIDKLNPCNSFLSSICSSLNL